MMHVWCYGILIFASLLEYGCILDLLSMKHIQTRMYILSLNRTPQSIRSYPTI